MRYPLIRRERPLDPEFYEPYAPLGHYSTADLADAYNTLMEEDTWFFLTDTCYQAGMDDLIYEIQRRGITFEDLEEALS